MNILHTLGLMTRKEHERIVRAVLDATEANYKVRFERAATDLAAQADEIARKDRALTMAGQVSASLRREIEEREMLGHWLDAERNEQADLIASLRPDAQKWRDYLKRARDSKAADRKRMAGKRGKPA